MSTNFSKHIARLMIIALILPMREYTFGGDSTPNAGQVVVVAGDDHSMEFTADSIKSRFAGDLHKIEFDSHGQHHSANAVSLLIVLKVAGLSVDLKMEPKADPKTKNWPLRQTIIVTGKDGYASAIALAELLPDIGNHAAYLAIDRDGAPLPDRSAPVELILPGDIKPGRWVRGIVSIAVIPPPVSAIPTTQP